jgi:hypothetical protein
MGAAFSIESEEESSVAMKRFMNTFGLIDTVAGMGLLLLINVVPVTTHVCVPCWRSETRSPFC